MVVSKALLRIHPTILILNCKGGEQTDSQIFNFAGDASPLALALKNDAESCLAVKGNLLDQAACAEGDATQSFTFG